MVGRGGILEFWPGRAWGEIVKYWTSLPQSLQGVLLLLVAAIVVWVVLGGSKSSRSVNSPGSYLPSPPPRSPSERYTYLKVYRDFNTILTRRRHTLTCLVHASHSSDTPGGCPRIIVSYLAWITLVAFAILGVNLVASGAIVGLLLIVVGMLLFFGIAVWSDVIQLALNIERHLRSIRYERPVATDQKTASTKDAVAADEDAIS